jgi:multiple sugar transport system permease protein
MLARRLKPRSRLAVTAYAFLLPGMALFALFMIYPLVKALQMSLYEWSILPGQPSTYVGLGNYVRAIQDPVVGVAARNTLLYMLVTVPGQMGLAMTVALLLHSLPRGRVVFRTLYYLPVITSWVIVSLLFRYLFQWPDGLINHILVNVFHFVTEPVQWLMLPGTALIAIMALGIWKGIGWSMVIYLAALESIPPEFHEVASIDGANAWQRFWKITLPLMRPPVVFTLVMLVIGGFNVFISVALMTGGRPMHQTDVLLTYMYHQAFDFLDFGYGAAISYLLAAVILLLSFLQLKFLRRPQEYY